MLAYGVSDGSLESGGRAAGLDTVAVRVLDLDDEATAEAFARTHDQEQNGRSA